MSTKSANWSLLRIKKSWNVGEGDSFLFTSVWMNCHGEHNCISVPLYSCLKKSEWSTYGKNHGLLSNVECLT